ncbi:hypothetical protein G6321_00042575 [Bradyrhizobium barranii subsp. barranii]|uniref:Uncharacterized protein n=1 Tax=Bradyrhizobium barranii subsp. barranii TaxID=2823807 RepID=A0A7Z0QC03_9BRAD|nr:hypothetical protein [Bradyrhizobium barranii]UGX92333.1 hypothetical protein G6321_00042575 [Bradyrhizobium barranii subsp. barranii]
MIRQSFLALAFFSSLIFNSSLSFAECRRIGPIDSVSIKNYDSILIEKPDLKQLRPLGFTDRSKIFSALDEVSGRETGGCWAGPSGNFDQQILSVGVLQWNYGQGSLQPIIAAFERKFTSRGEFIAWQKKMMPKYGAIVFSAGCKRLPTITDKCSNALLPLTNGKLDPDLRKELDTLFNSNEMIQIQVDRFVRSIQSVRDDLGRVFGQKKSFSYTQVRWAIDTKIQQGGLTKIQQGGFPVDRDIQKMRAEWNDLPNKEEKQKALLALVDWYRGLSYSADQGGVSRDRECNVQSWQQKINSSTSAEQDDLLNLTFLRSRTATGMSGFWQANAFQRRAKIALNVGSVGGDRVGIAKNCVVPAVTQKVTQGSDVKRQETNLERMNAGWEKLSDEEKRQALLALVDWYKGLSFSVYQGWVSRDRECNVQYWRQKINAGISAEQAQKLNRAFLESRVDKWHSGFRQALIFEREATRILGVGSIEGDRIGIESTSSCIPPASAVS